MKYDFVNAEDLIGREFQFVCLVWSWIVLIKTQHVRALTLEPLNVARHFVIFEIAKDLNDYVVAFAVARMGIGPRCLTMIKTRLA